MIVHKAFLRSCSIDVVRCSAKDLFSLASTRDFTKLGQHALPRSWALVT